MLRISGGEIAKKINILEGTLLLECKVKKNVKKLALFKKSSDLCGHITKTCWTMLKYLIFFLGTLSIYAQKEYCFQYDSAGNQRSALLCLNGKDDATDEELFNELPEALKSSETDNSSKITLQGAPNPVTDNLAVYWHHSENGVLTQLVVFSVDGKMMYRTDQIPANEPFHINVSTWSAGSYFLVATFSDGSRKVFKVVKK